MHHPNRLLEHHRVKLGYHLPFTKAAKRATLLTARACAELARILLECRDQLIRHHTLRRILTPSGKG